MRPLSIAVLVFLTVFGAELSLGQQTNKRETDRDERELKGSVCSLKVTTEVIEAANKDDADEGWKPSESTFDKYGNILTEVQFGSDGEIIDKMIAEIDKSGNKVKETHFNNVGELKFTYFLGYDRNGNVIESKSVEADGKIVGMSRFEFDKQGRNESNTSYNPDGTVNTTVRVIYDKFGERVQTTNSSPLSGVGSRFEYKRAKEKGGEILETIIFNPDGTLHSRYLETTKDGDRTILGFDKEGTVAEKLTVEHTKRDAHGNWTMEIVTRWETKDKELALKIKKKTTRSIGYF
ncbi:MAG: hypothetical protein ABL999_03950 [Pyrinomonadaceae bacterium]